MNKRLLIISAVVFLIVLVIFAITIKARNKVSETRSTDNPDSFTGLLNQAKDLETKGKLWDAKNMYQRLVNEFSSSGEVMNWQKRAEDINIKLLFSPTLTPKSILYVVKPGDTLTKIAKEFKTTIELIMRSNNLSDDKLRAGERIKIWTLPFNILVDKSQNILILKSDEEVIKTYLVSTGVDNSTPVGNFKITNKLPNPTWFKDGVVIPSGNPENILGSRWLGFDLVGYGIHGTTEPQTLGKQVTQGCVRMSNSDVEELYTIIPVGTEVTVVD